MKKGLFLSFEGIDGCGKSTQIAHFKTILEEKKLPYISLREPGGCDISEKIRSILLDKKNSRLCDEAEVLLFAAARAQLIDEVILPALSEGKIVLCDRYIDSSFAYQAYARGLGYDFVYGANAYAIKSCMPDHTFFFNASPNDVLKRVTARGELDRLELLGTDFQAKVYDGYLRLIKKDPERFIIINAEKTAAEVSKEISLKAEEIF